MVRLKLQKKPSNRDVVGAKEVFQADEDLVDLQGGMVDQDIEGHLNQLGLREEELCTQGGEVANVLVMEPQS